MSSDTQSVLSYQFLSDARTVKNVQVVTLTWMTYEIIVTFGDEITYIWWSPWSIPKALYLFTRYFGLARAMFDTIITISFMPKDGCHAIGVVSDVSQATVGLTAEALLLIRVIAIWQFEQTPRRLLFGGYVVIVLVEYLFSTLVHPPSATYVTDVGGCLHLPAPASIDYTLIALMPALAFSVIMFSLILMRVLRYSRESAGWTPLLARLFSDGALYFALVAGTLTVSMALSAIWATRSPLNMIPSLFVGAVYPVASCRLLLNLRDFIHPASDETDAGRNPPELLEMRVSNSSGMLQGDERVSWDSWTDSTTESSRTYSLT